MLHVVNSIQEITSASGTLRAGGTDYMDRRRHGLADGDIVDIVGIAGLDQIETDSDGQTFIGALTTVHNLANTSHIHDNYAGFAQAAASLATPQIRMVGTVGGNLTQATRCQYYRHNHLQCTKKGDAACGAREGYHPNGVIFDNGGCANPHPSTLGMALMTYGAQVEINGSEIRSVADIYGDGSDHSRDHLLGDGEVITKVIMPAPVAEKSAYFRASQRARAEWATVECVARLVMDGETIRAAHVAVGAVGPVPMCLANVEAELVGKPASEETFAEAASLAAGGANPLRDTGYKVQVLVHSVEEVLLRAVGMSE